MAKLGGYHSRLFYWLQRNSAINTPARRTKAIFYCVASLQPAMPPEVFAFFFSLFSFKN